MLRCGRNSLMIPCVPALFVMASTCPLTLVKVIVAVKGIDKVILITDAVHVAQLPPGKIQIGGNGH